jgi:tryptophanyl-tRNA synthetase
MSKSAGNSIYLGEASNSLLKKIKSMYTDPKHLRVEDPGHIEGNVVFSYLDVFDPDVSEVARLKEHYQRGGLADGVVKSRLADVLEHFIAPIRERRQELERDKGEVLKILKEGTEKAREQIQQTMERVRDAMKIMKL